VDQRYSYACCQSRDRNVGVGRPVHKDNEGIGCDSGASGIGASETPSEFNQIQRKGSKRDSR
jgi:hypothetical protein